MKLTGQTKTTFITLCDAFRASLVTAGQGPGGLGLIWGNATNEIFFFLENIAGMYKSDINRVKPL